MFKAEIWKNGKIVKNTECMTIDILRIWFREHYWEDYNNGKCSLRVYADDVPLTPWQTINLGFYRMA